MDSLTQAVLGAAVFCPVYMKLAKRPHVRTGLLTDGATVVRGCLLGACLGTLPDLDVLVPLGDPVSDFVYHRGPSHSLIMQALVSPLIAFALVALQGKLNQRESKSTAWPKLSPKKKKFLSGFSASGFTSHWPLMRCSMLSPFMEPRFFGPLVKGPHPGPRSSSSILSTLCPCSLG